MASTDTSVADTAKTVPESQVYTKGTSINLFVADFTLRVLLFASTVTAVVVMVTSKQTEMLPTPIPGVRVSRDAKFNHSPTFIYLLAALSVTCLYSIFTTLASARSISKPSPSNKLLFCLAFTDLLMAGIVASATGAAAAVAYIGIRGNSHTGWTKICPIYGKFCRHMGSSIAVSLAASVVLVLLVMLSTYSLYRRSR